MSTGSISLDILLNQILTDALSGGSASIRAIQKKYPSVEVQKSVSHREVIQYYIEGE